MDLMLLLARLLLVGVFGVAGAAKLADRVGSRQLIVDFGVPVRLAGSLGVVLPLAELSVAFALIPLLSMWWGALGALTLLCLFIVGISLSLVRGHKPHCRCFGQLHASPVGWATLARNAMLMVLAGLLVWHGVDKPGLSFVPAASPLTAIQLIGIIAGIIMVAVLIGVGWILLELLKQNGRLLLRIEALESPLAPQASGIPFPTLMRPGLSVGTRAPAFRLPDLDGTLHSLDDLLAAARPVLLIFSDPSCSVCTALLPDLSLSQRDHSAKVKIVLISCGSVDTNRAKVAEYGLLDVLLQRDREVVTAYQVEGVPAAVLVQLDGTVGSSIAHGSEAIRRLAAQTTGTVEPIPLGHGNTVPSARADDNSRNRIKSVPELFTTRKIGEPAPVFKLSNLSGEEVDLGQLRGSPTLLLFWNPACDFCERMLGDVRSLEIDSSSGAPKLLIVSTGGAEANRAMGLKSPIVLDQNFSTGRAFGASGTPMAVLIDAKWRIASEVVAGASAILALASQNFEAALADAEEGFIDGKVAEEGGGGRRLQSRTTDNVPRGLQAEHGYAAGSLNAPIKKIGKYIIQSKIGEGGMGVVYKAYDPFIERTVAIKMMSPELAAAGELRKRFNSEATSIAQLSHINVVMVYEISEDAGCPYFVMEYLDGEDLRAEIVARKERSLEEKLQIISDICHALSYAHQIGVIHGDIKPANIFVTTSGQVKILDFGMGNTVSSLTTQAPPGTPGYTSPEQWDHGKVDDRSDIFAVGAVFYEFLTGKRAFEYTFTTTWRGSRTGVEETQGRGGLLPNPVNLLGESYDRVFYKLSYSQPEALKTQDPTLPPGLLSIILRMLSKESSKRYGSMDEVLRDLEIFRLSLDESKQSLRPDVEWISTDT